MASAGYCVDDGVSATDRFLKQPSTNPAGAQNNSAIGNGVSLSRDVEHQFLDPMDFRLRFRTSTAGLPAIQIVPIQPLPTFIVRDKNGKKLTIEGEKKDVSNTGRALQPARQKSTRQSHIEQRPALTTVATSTPKDECSRDHLDQTSNSRQKKEKNKVVAMVRKTPKKMAGNLTWKDLEKTNPGTFEEQGVESSSESSEGDTSKPKESNLVAVGRGKKEKLKKAPKSRKTKDDDSVSSGLLFKTQTQQTYTHPQLNMWPENPHLQHQHNPYLPMPFHAQQPPEPMFFPFEKPSALQAMYPTNQYPYYPIQPFYPSSPPELIRDKDQEKTLEIDFSVPPPPNWTPPEQRDKNKDKDKNQSSVIVQDKTDTKKAASCADKVDDTPPAPVTIELQPLPDANVPNASKSSKSNATRNKHAEKIVNIRIENVTNIGRRKSRTTESQRKVSYFPDEHNNDKASSVRAGAAAAHISSPPLKLIGDSITPIALGTVQTLSDSHSGTQSVRSGTSNHSKSTAGSKSTRFSHPTPKSNATSLTAKTTPTATTRPPSNAAHAPDIDTTWSLNPNDVRPSDSVSRASSSGIRAPSSRDSPTATEARRTASVPAPAPAQTRSKYRAPTVETLSSASSERRRADPLVSIRILRYGGGAAPSASPVITSAAPAPVGTTTDDTAHGTRKSVRAGPRDPTQCADASPTSRRARAPSSTSVDGTCGMRDGGGGERVVYYRHVSRARAARLIAREARAGTGAG